MNAPKSVSASFSDNASYTATSIPELEDCLKDIQIRTCVLKERPEPYEVTRTILIDRSDVVVRGGTANMHQTKLARHPEFTGDLIRIGETAPVTGVALKYLTVCGGSNITPNWASAPASAICGPRVQTVCGERTIFATWNPRVSGQPALCRDISVVRSALPVFPTHPFNAPPASYAVEFDHVDLEDATGHALSLFGANGLHVDDIYFHHGAINYSGVTGILLGVLGVDYSRKECDRYADPVLGFANETHLLGITFGHKRKAGRFPERIPRSATRMNRGAARSNPPPVPIRFRS
jgi:hypothetical protein